LILYTPLPPELVLENTGEKHKPSYLQIPFSRGFMEVELTSPTTARIVRLISCDLNDYLQPHFQPGREIRLKWEAGS
jgi:hypothetical protein